MKQLKEKSAPIRVILPILTAVIIMIVVLFAAGSGAKQRISVTKNAVEMGTAVSLTVYGEKGRLPEEKRREQLSETASGILADIRALDRNILSWRSEDSEVYRFNHHNEDRPMNISPELAEVIRGSLEIAAASGSAMDITLRPLIELWGIETADPGSAYVPPSPDEIEKVSAAIGWEHLILNEEPSGGSRLEKDIPGLSLDLGAVGKGFALDAAYRSLSDSDISGAVLAVGGSVLACGDKGEPWQIGIRDPEGAPNETIGILSVPGKEGNAVFLSTSGGYEKYVEYEGHILEHILDSRTLYPAESELFSVTIVTRDSGLVSDGLSTACYLLGIEASKPLLERYHADAVFVTKDGKIYLTDGVKDMFSLTDPAYSVLEMP